MEPNLNPFKWDTENGVIKGVFIGEDYFDLFAINESIILHQLYHAELKRRQLENDAKPS